MKTENRRHTSSGPVSLCVCVCVSLPAVVGVKMLTRANNAKIFHTLHKVVTARQPATPFPPPLSLLALLLSRQAPVKLQTLGDCLAGCL